MIPPRTSLTRSHAIPRQWTGVPSPRNLMRAGGANRSRKIHTKLAMKNAVSERKSASLALRPASDETSARTQILVERLPRKPKEHRNSMSLREFHESGDKAD